MKATFRCLEKGKTIMTNSNEELNLQDLDQVIGGTPASSFAGASASGEVSGTVTKTLDGGNAGGLFLVTLIGSYLH
jgi:hypothetical protein